MKNFVDSIWLEKHINDHDVFIIDCRFDLFDPSYGRIAYNESHIMNAFFLDINEDFAGEKGVHGGARPLPEFSVLGKKLEDMGIRMDSKIVFYDDTIYSCGRAWWQLKYMGFDQVYILNGGFVDWKKLDLPVSVSIPDKRQNGKVDFEVVDEIYCHIDYVKSAMEDPNIILIDSREGKRYIGEFEPFYSKKGHIPGALNLHWKKNMDDKGKIKDMDMVAENFSFAENAEEIIVHCGSGIAGAMNFVVLHELGYRTRLYVGSVSDWLSYEENDLELN